MEYVEYNFANIFNGFSVCETEPYYNVIHGLDILFIEERRSLFEKTINEALENSSSKGNICFGVPMSNKAISLVRKTFRIDISNRNQTLSKDYIRHLYKHSKETNPKQISITKEDIKRIPEILSNPDTVIIGSDTLDAARKNKIPSIRYVKSYITGKYYVVVAISKKGDLQIKTMWKETIKLIPSSNALHHTSQTANNDFPTLNDKIITKYRQNVKWVSTNIVGITSLSFTKQIDLWNEGKWNKQVNLVVFKNTPKLYLDLGLKDNAITVTARKIDRIVNISGKQDGTYHGLGIDVVKHLPQAIIDPLNIVESNTVNDSIVVITKLIDSNDNPVIVSILIDGKGRVEICDTSSKLKIKNIDANVMTSAYGRNNYDKWISDNKNKIIYDKDEGIIKKRVNGQWLQLPNDVNSSDNIVTKHN